MLRVHVGEAKKDLPFHKNIDNLDKDYSQG
jgi:hypothetical protein